MGLLAWGWLEMGTQSLRQWYQLGAVKDCALRAMTEALQNQLCSSMSWKSGVSRHWLWNELFVQDVSELLWGTGWWRVALEPAQHHRRDTTLRRTVAVWGCPWKFPRWSCSQLRRLPAESAAEQRVNCGKARSQGPQGDLVHLLLQGSRREQGPRALALPSWGGIGSEDLNKSVELGAGGMVHPLFWTWLVMNQVQGPQRIPAKRNGRWRQDWGWWAAKYTQGDEFLTG